MGKVDKCPHCGSSFGKEFDITRFVRYTNGESLVIFCNECHKPIYIDKASLLSNSTYVYENENQENITFIKENTNET